MDFKKIKLSIAAIMAILTAILAGPVTAIYLLGAAIVITLGVGAIRIIQTAQKYENEEE